MMLAFCSQAGIGGLRAAEPSAWIDLFDGKSLDGWIQKNGTASYRVIEGTIVGRTSEGSPNSFLCTREEFGDFELEFEVRVDNRLNSGVQIRSQTKEVPAEASAAGKFGRVFGPQVEIEASGEGGAESGYLYGEATGRGWLTPEDRLIPHKQFRDGGWNSYRIVAQGPRIRTWINGHPIEDLTDEAIYQTHPVGFIGLQVHGIAPGAGPYEVAWRKIRIRNLDSEEGWNPGDNRLSDEEREAGWRLLFNGRDMAGWRNSNDRPLAGRVEHGSLNPHQAGSYVVVHEEQFGDFVLKCDVKMSGPHCNSGIFVRVGDLRDPVQTGLELQIHGGTGVGRNAFGSIYDLVAPSENASRGPGEWNHIEIRCDGPLVTATINGKLVTRLNCDEFDQPGMRPDGSRHKYRNAIKEFPRRGYLGFQDHGHDVWFKNVKLRELAGGR
jgi:hypothetical protein